MVRYRIADTEVQIIGAKKIKKNPTAPLVAKLSMKRHLQRWNNVAKIRR
jgi:hypothetical protein